MRRNGPRLKVADIPKYICKGGEILLILGYKVSQKESMQTSLILLMIALELFSVTVLNVHMYLGKPDNGWIGNYASVCPFDYRLAGCFIVRMSSDLIKLFFGELSEYLCHIILLSPFCRFTRPSHFLRTRRRILQFLQATYH